MSIFGEDFLNLRRQLHLADSQRASWLTMPTNYNGQTFLNDEPGARALYGHAAAQRYQNQVTSPAVTNGFNKVYDEYKTAAAFDDRLMLSDFLNNYKWGTLRSESNWRERGEDPGSFMRPGGFRLYGA